jgi:hypothetical protein
LESAIFGLIGVVVGAILTTAKDWWFDYRRQSKDLQFLSIHVICMLEKFVANCIEVTQDDGLEDHGYKSPQVEHPSLDLMSLDVEWKSLPSDLMYKILNLPTLIADANSFISVVVDYEAGPPDYEEFFEARTIKYSELGLLTIEIANELRKICKWDTYTRDNDGWDRKKQLEDAKNKAIKTIEKRHANNSLMMNLIK